MKEIDCHANNKWCLTWMEKTLKVDVKKILPERTSSGTLLEANTKSHVTKVLILFMMFPF